MTSPFADNVLCAVTANESGQTTYLWVCFGDCNFSGLSLLLHCVHSTKEKKNTHTQTQKKEKKICKKKIEKRQRQNIYDKIT